MSHKTLYIDVDEEITSIIDRLRKAEAPEVIVVVPKQAVLIQSLVNLKLLKKEADRRKKKIMLVTQDRIGKKLIEKAGILVQKKADEEMLDESETFISEKKERSKNIPQDFLDSDEEEEKIGTSDFFEKIEAPVPESKSKPEEIGNNIGNIRFGEPKAEKPAVPPKTSAKAATSANPPVILKKKEKKAEKNNMVSMSDIVAGSEPRPKRMKRKKEEAPYAEIEKGTAPSVKESFAVRETQRQKKIDTDKFFQMSAAVSERGAKRKETILGNTKVKGKAGKYFVIFAVLILLLLIAAGAYLYLPKATLSVQLASETRSVSENITANVSNAAVDPSQSLIPAILEKVSLEKSDTFSPTGGKTGAGKAGGSVTIYNEFSADPQPLVATTRLQTSDGKIFRITKDIEVPGMTKSGTDNNPGTIDVPVIADQAGADYNIDPADFKIVGFQGGPKADKIYAKSTEAMTGGGESGGVATVTAQDIANAKEKLTAEAKQDAIQKLKDSLGANRKFFEDNVTVNVLDSSSSDAVGANVQNFTYQINAQAETLSYSEDDIKTLIDKKDLTDIQNAAQINFGKPFNYILSNADLASGNLEFQVKTDVDIQSAIDLENFKKGVLGKNAAQLSDFVKTYPAIKNAEVSFSPFFVSRVPMNAKRVNVVVK